MDPYDRRAVQAVWSRVAPGRNVLGRQATGGKPPVDAVRQACCTLASLARGYDALAAQKRAPILRQMAAQCRRNADALGFREEATIEAQRMAEADLTKALSELHTPQSAALLRDSQERTQSLRQLQGAQKRYL